jgi:hypothetical protein
VYFCSRGRPTGWYHSTEFVIRISRRSSIITVITVITVIAVTTAIAAIAAIAASHLGRNYTLPKYIDNL